jgi:hypothetical protein
MYAVNVSNEIVSLISNNSKFYRPLYSLLLSEANLTIPQSSSIKQVLALLSLSIRLSQSNVMRVAQQVVQKKNIISMSKSSKETAQSKGWGKGALSAQRWW